eukprot:jgi/Chrpa1/6097/Chrysochromulina_OHIO_Genome00015224-RA
MWAEGDGATLAAALGAASCVVAELDVSGSQLAADECLALANARHLHTLDLSGTAVAASAASLEAVSHRPAALAGPAGARPGRP